MDVTPVETRKVRRRTWREVGGGGEEGRVLSPSPASGGASGERATARQTASAVRPSDNKALRHPLSFVRPSRSTPSSSSQLFYPPPSSLATGENRSRRSPRPLLTPTSALTHPRGAHPDPTIRPPDLALTFPSASAPAVCAGTSTHTLRTTSFISRLFITSSIALRLRSRVFGFQPTYLRASGLGFDVGFDARATTYFV
ncbi:hypothetical protein BO71DRAFT_67075 [Aspergillus ellipticus CBS 707.79]|uniref:Uncharacterized protein n=1 Tax=Aspergillus ellipticus CBS 707.79 TaxID=1448320 RepID=A0A319D8K2_9EURO|nr:hypothetical protein BO71DRAFT_67075 [Aspergillus ellipticus CBS 707.79]